MPFTNAIVCNHITLFGGCLSFDPSSVPLFMLTCRMLKAQKAFEEDEEKVKRLVKGFQTETVYHTDRWVCPSEELMQDQR